MENTQVGPFRVGQRLGRNRRQRVFRATQVEQDLEVALKFIRIPEKVDRSKAIEKIQIEVEHLKRLDHPNLVRILGAGIENDQIFFAYELIEGESLSSLLSRRGRLAVDQVVDFAQQLADVLSYLHEENIVHSKLTPDKILATDSGQIKVADLRLNRSKKRRWDSANKRELDIAAYMAPEQLQTGPSRKTDIYSLGVLLYELLSGKLPHEPDTIGRMTRSKMHRPVKPISSSVMNCPVWLDQMVCKMIAPDPKVRPHTAKVVSLAMKQLSDMDKKEQGAISQVNRGFNPLTAGADRSEANRLLGPPKRWKFDPAILQSTGALLIGLVLIMAIITFALWPESSESKFSRARSLLQSERISDWRQARDLLQSITASATSPLAKSAEELYFDSRRRILLSYAERGRTVELQSENMQSFIEAYQLQANEQRQPAAAIYQRLVDSIDPSGDQRHIYQEAKNRLVEIQNDQTQTPTDALEPDNVD